MHQNMKNSNPKSLPDDLDRQYDTSKNYLIFKNNKVDKAVVDTVNSLRKFQDIKDKIQEK